MYFVFVRVHSVVYLVLVAVLSVVLGVCGS